MDIYSQATPICSFYTLEVEKALVKDGTMKQLQNWKKLKQYVYSFKVSASLYFNPYILYDIIFTALYGALLFSYSFHYKIREQFNLIYDRTCLCYDVLVSDRLAEVFWAQQSLEFTQIKRDSFEKDDQSGSLQEGYTNFNLTTLWHQGEQKRISKSSDAEETSDSTPVCKKQEHEATVVTGPARLYS